MIELDALSQIAVLVQRTLSIRNGRHFRILHHEFLRFEELDNAAVERKSQMNCLVETRIFRKSLGGTERLG